MQKGWQVIDDDYRIGTIIFINGDIHTVSFENGIKQRKGYHLKLTESQNVKNILGEYGIIE